MAKFYQRGEMVCMGNLSDSFFFPPMRFHKLIIGRHLRSGTPHSFAEHQEAEGSGALGSG